MSPEARVRRRARAAGGRKGYWGWAAQTRPGLAAAAAAALPRLGVDLASDLAGEVAKDYDSASP